MEVPFLRLHKPTFLQSLSPSHPSPPSLLLCATQQPTGPFAENEWEMWEVFLWRGGPDSGPCPSCPQSDALVSNSVCTQWVTITQKPAACPHREGQALQHSRQALHGVELHQKSWGRTQTVGPEVCFPHWDAPRTLLWGWAWSGHPQRGHQRLPGQAQHHRATCWVPDPEPGRALFGISALMWAVGSYSVCNNGRTSFFPPSFPAFFCSTSLQKERRGISGSKWSLPGGSLENGCSLTQGKDTFHWALYASVFQTTLCDPSIDHEIK